MAPFLPFGLEPWIVVWVPKLEVAASDRTYVSAAAVTVSGALPTWIRSERTRVLVPPLFVTVSETA